VAGAPTPPGLNPCTISFFVSEGVDRPQRLISVLASIRAHCRVSPLRNPLNIPRALFTNSSPKAFLSMTSSRTEDAATVLCLGSLISFCHVAAVSDLGHFLCLWCIPGLSTVSPRPYVVSAFIVPPGSWCNLSQRHFPRVMLLLHGGSFSCRRRSVSSGIHNLPRSFLSASAGAPRSDSGLYAASSVIWPASLRFSSCWPLDTPLRTA
jgi:hypothetical protein